jgi:hypothetical protein
MGRQVDYDHLHNEIMGAVTLVASGKDEEVSERYGELIDFLETMYVNSVLSLAGALLTMAKHSSEREVSEASLTAARELLDAPKTHVHAKLMDRYRDMILMGNLPDAYQVKTHNEQVSEEIKEELETSGT